MGHFVGCQVEGCGRWAGGFKDLCQDCFKEAQRRYPQGWVGYPGDKCVHGIYVGGCGVDYMCGLCEAGEEVA